MKALTGLFDRLYRLLARRPTLSFIILLTLLFGIIALGSLLREPRIQSEMKSPQVKSTEVFRIGHDIATYNVPALTRKENVITVVALTPGIVSNIAVAPGQVVGSGRILLTLTNDYQSGAKDIEKELARNADQLQQELYELEKRINDLEKKQVKKDDELNDLAETIELKKLKSARERMKSERTASSLNMALALTNDAVLKPRTYTNGTVERIFVRRGDQVSTGTPLVSLRSVAGISTLEVVISKETAELFDPEIESQLMLSDTESASLLPTYFSRQETLNGLYSILYTLSDTLRSKVTDGLHATLRIPLSAATPGAYLVPIDSIFQDNKRAWVMIIEDGRSTMREVTLGNVSGAFVEVRTGLEAGMTLVLNRNVLPDENVTVTE